MRAKAVDRSASWPEKNKVIEQIEQYLSTRSSAFKRSHSFIGEDFRLLAGRSVGDRLLITACYCVCRLTQSVYMYSCVHVL